MKIFGRLVCYQLPFKRS